MGCRESEARQCAKVEGIFFFDLEEVDLKETMKNARKKLELPMEAAMLCKLKTHQYREICGESDNRTSKRACIVEAHESTRKRLESTLPQDHEDCIVGKGFNSTRTTILAHKFVPMPQALKILDAKAAMDRDWEKLEKLPAWQLNNLKSKREVTLEAQRD